MDTKDMSKQKLPKWFKGCIYDEGAEVVNPFTGLCYKLNNVELSMYDYIKGCEMISDWDGLRKGLDWFRGANAKAYLVLLD